MAIVVNFYGSDTNDPTAAGVLTVLLPFAEFAIDTKELGVGTKDGLGAPRNPRRYRFVGSGKSFTFTRSASLTETDYGRFMFFKEQIRTSRYIWINRVYEGPAGPTTPPALRADYDRDDLAVVTSSNTMWYASAAALDGYPSDAVQGKLPMLIEILSVERSDVTGGRYTFTMEWQSVGTYTGSKA